MPLPNNVQVLPAGQCRQLLLQLNKFSVLCFYGCQQPFIFKRSFTLFEGEADAFQQTVVVPGLQDISVNRTPRISPQALLTLSESG